MMIIDEQPPKPKHDVVSSRNIFLGIALIAAGIVWMCNNLDIMPDHIFRRIFSWQMLLMVLGAYGLAVRQWVWGGVLLCIGGVFALTDWFGIHLPVGEVILPMIVIAAGVAVLVRRMSR